jgi:hypothetical protein
VLESHESDHFVKLQNRLVNFRIRDVHSPDLDKILAELYGRQLLEGWVTGIVNDGTDEERYAIIEVAGLENPIFVLVDRILGIVK